MIRGVSFKIPQTKNVLWQILKCINIKEYCWYNIESQNEVWNNPLGSLFFEADFYSGESFYQHIQLCHYIVFLKLQAYFETDNFYDINNYNEFQKSDCQLLLLVYDCEFVEIYIKEESVTKAIYENALQSNCTNVNYITDYNDKRKELNVI